MKLLGMWMQGYGSFWGRHYVPLADRGLVAVVGENLDDPRASSNGAGKTTWTDALDWALFGQVPRNDASGSNINEEAGRGMCVTVAVVDDDGNLLRIRRLRDYSGHPNGPQLFVNGENMTALDADRTQQLIEERLGLDREVFHATVLFAQQATWQFADATDAERKALLVKIIPELGEVDRLALRAQDRLEEARATHARLAPEVQTRRAMLTNLEALDPRPRADQWERERAATLAQAEEHLAQLRVEFGQATAELAQVPQVPDQPPGQVPPPPGYAEAKTAETKASQAARRAGEELAVLRSRGRDSLAALKRAKERNPEVCPTCGQRVSAPDAAAHLAKEVARLQTEHDTLVAQGHQAVAVDQAAQQASREAQAAREGLDQLWQQERQRVAGLHAQGDATRAHARTIRQRLDAVGGQIEGITRQAQQLRAALNPILADVDRWAQQVDTERRWLAVQEVNLADLSRRLAALEFWKVGLGAKGLKSYVLDSRVADMAQEANRWVSLLTGGTAWVEFSTQREVGKGKAKKLVEELTIKVCKANPDGTVTQRNYRSWSGGEKYRLALGIDFGLARLVARRARRSYDLMILDEVFQKSLDRAGKDAVAEMLLHLSREKSSIFVIDHDVQFQHLFELMTVRKERRRSRFVGGGGISHDGFDPNHVLATHSAFPD